MPDMPSITMVKRFTYRTQNEEWSNTYHFSGTTPADAAAWKTLADAIAAQEKTILHVNTSVVKAYGYEAGNDHSVAQIDYTVAPNTPVAGLFNTPPSAQLQCGDVAACVRWYTGRTNTRGRKVYVWKYFHGAWRASTDVDTLDSGYRTLLGTFAAKMIDGTLPGSFKYCAPQGQALSAPYVLPYLTTRTLKRRGKRP